MPSFGNNNGGPTAGPWSVPGDQGPTGQGAEPTAAEREAAWIAALEKNQLPAFVQQRLVAAGKGQVPWLSTMTAAELGLARSHGIRPLATVSGTCWFQYGYSWTKGHAEGWRTAIARLKHEALLVGANAVVDVKLRRIAMEVESSLDFTVIGTAVRVDGLKPSSDPIVSTVPALEFVRLLEAGIVPVGLAVGAEYSWLGNYYVPVVVRGTPWQSYPLPEIGQFWEQVRRKAHAELRADTRRQGDGVLAHTNFGQLLRFEENGETRYLGRHIVMGTVVDTGGSKGLGLPIRTIVDMRDEHSPFWEEAVSRNYGPVHEEAGEI